MKRARSPSSGGSSDRGDTSSEAYEDIIAQATTELDKYGVSWKFFDRGNTREKRIASWRAIKDAVRSSEVQAYYIGVCKSPARRFFEEPAPHKFKYDVLYPLLIGKDMGKVERNFLEVLVKGEICTSKLRNKSKGGEGSHRKSVRFLYVCIKWSASAATSSA